MVFNIIIFIIILIILTLILHHSKSYKEGFFDFPDADHNTFVDDSAAKYNQLTNTINLIDPAIPVSPDSASAFKIALGGLSAKPTSTVYNIAAKNDYMIPDNIPNTFQQAKSCEAAGTSCSAFDDPTFAAQCGMSFDNKAIGSDGKPHIGGLYVSPDDRQKQMDKANDVLSTGGAPYDPYKVYQPTLGKSKRGTFALNKDQCVVVKEKVDCLAKQTFSSPNCTQCYTSQNFARVGPETQRLPATVYFVGNGNISVGPQNAGAAHNYTADELAQINSGKSENAVCEATAGQQYQAGFGIIPQCGGAYCCANVPFAMITTLNANTPVSMPIMANSEGTTFHIAVETTDGSLPYVAGFIQGQTPRGTFNLDLMSLVDKDYTSGKRPKINGTTTINGFKSFVFIPSANNKVTLNGMIPFSFLSIYDGDALTCDNGPIVTQAASATFLESDPCYGKANKPGNYKIDCLQTRWVELGGTQQGTGYPGNQAAADLLQKDANGQPLDIDTIVNNLAPKMTAALTGKDASGKDLSLPDWNTVSMYATGIPINTPCDGGFPDGGPLTQECLSYLYLNQGVTSHIGGTYTLAPSSMASMKGQATPNTYCQPGAGIDPATPAGLKFGQGLGGINAVKQTYDQINRTANDNTLSNDKRSTAVQQCYGVNLDAITSGKTTGPTQVFAVGPGYNYTQAQAQGVCSQYGAQVATTAQLQDAQSKGADWCFTGWVSDSNTAMYPITTSTEAGCGNGTSGVIQWNTGNGNAGVNCYGPKPGIDNFPENTIMPFSQTAWDYNPNAPATPPAPKGIFTVIAGGGTDPNIWYADSNLAQPTMPWNQIPGGLQTISLAPQGFIFGTNSGGYIFYLAQYNKYPGGWTNVPGSLHQISTDGINVVGTNINNNAYAAKVSDALAGRWTTLPSVLTKIVTFKNQYYCLGLDQHIYYLTSPSAQWIQTLTSGVFKDIAIDNGVVLLVGTDSVLYYSDSNLFSASGQYQQVPNQPTKFNTISLSNGSIYAIDTGGAPWFTPDYTSGSWTKVVGAGQVAPSHRIINSKLTTQKAYGNNGTVTCSTYCAGTGGSSWNGELPTSWNGSICVGAGGGVPDCNSGFNYVAGQTYCECAPSGTGWN